MAAYRKPIDFDPGQAKDNLVGGGCSVLLGWFITAIAFIIEKKSLLDWVIPFGLLLLVAFFILLVGDQAFSDGLVELRRNEKWRKKTTVVETNIIDRREIYYEDDGYTAAYSLYHIALNMDPDQQAVCPGEAVIIASVSQGIFKRYAHKKSARIYYFSADPLFFLMEGEIPSAL